MMADWWRKLIWDEFAVRPEVARFALAVLDELQSKGIAKPKLLPEENGSLAFTWKERGGTRYMFFGEDYLEESILRNRGQRWIEVSYAEKAEQASDTQSGPILEISTR
jgi:hypothetical protein